MIIESIVDDPVRMIKIGKLAAKYHPINFENFEKRIFSYLDFFVVTIEGELAAISGIYRYDKWFKDLYRVADRSFYFPIIRETSLAYPQGKKNRTILSEHLIPMQTQIVLDQGGIPFYSMLGHPNALSRSARLHNQNSENKYIMMKDKYFTCPSNEIEDRRCWQNINVLEQHQDLFNDRTLRKVL